MLTDMSDLARQAMDIRSRHRWIGLVPNVVFFFAVILFVAVFTGLNHCGVGDAVAAAILFFGLFNGFFVMSLVLFDVWWFGRRRRFFLVLSAAAFALNALFWLMDIAMRADGV